MAIEKLAGIEEIDGTLYDLFQDLIKEVRKACLLGDCSLFSKKFKIPEEIYLHSSSCCYAAWRLHMALYDHRGYGKSKGGNGKPISGTPKAGYYHEPEF